MKKTLLIGLFSLSLFSIMAQTITLQPDAATGKDALLHGLESEVDKNYGSNPQMTANSWTFSGEHAIIRSLIEFDLTLIPSGSIIDNAYLSLYSWDTDGGMGNHSSLEGSNDCLLQRVTSNWDESTVTWNTQPTTDTINQIELLTSVSFQQDYLDIDVTSLIQTMIDSTNYGFMFKLQDETDFRRMNFSSSDHTDASLHPKLVITYSGITEITKKQSDSKGASIYPNPFSLEAIIEFDNGNNQMYTLKIFDMQGRIVKAIDNIETGSVSITRDNLSSGLYFYQLNTTGLAPITGNLIIE